MLTISKSIGPSLLLLAAYLGSSSAFSSIQVFFNHRESSQYVEPYRQLLRSGDNLEGEIIRAIQSAKTSVEVAVQELSLPDIAKALGDAVRRGVRVRLILENQYSRPMSDLSEAEILKLDPYMKGKYEEFVKLVDVNQDGSLSEEETRERDALKIIRGAGVQWIDDTADGSMGSGLMHHKFVIIDGMRVIITSANFSHSDIHGDFSSLKTTGNANSLLTLLSSDLAVVFLEEFEILWSKKFGLKKRYRPSKSLSLNGIKIKVQFSPVSKTKGWEASVNGLIERELLAARQSADLALFVFSEQRLVNALRNTTNVRALIEPGFAYRYYSELLDMLGLKMRDTKCRYEAANNPWLVPISAVGIPLLEGGDKFHHKFAVLDENRVIVGSHNWSNAANHTNDETLIVIESSFVVKEYFEEFNRAYRRSIIGVPAWLTQKIQKIDEQCLFIQ